MSGSQDGAGRREVAYRLFAAEFDDADFSYSESDEERAPNYVVTPTGARVNRLFLVGVLTEVETVSEDYLRARVVDPTGPFVVYAGQYQPDALAFLERAEPPLFVAVTGKARTYEPDDADTVYTSVRPESISEVDADTRDRWVVTTAEQTLDRVARCAEAKLADIAGDDLEAALEATDVDEGLAAGIPIALEHYGTSGDYLAAMRDLALDAARVVAGERDEVDPLSLAPDQGGDDPLPDLAERTLDAGATGDAAGDVEATVAEGAPTSGEPVDERAGTAAPQRTDDPEEPTVDATDLSTSESDAEPGGESATGTGEADAASDEQSAGATGGTDRAGESDTASATDTSRTGSDGTADRDAIADAEEPVGDIPPTADGAGPTTEDAGASDTSVAEDDAGDDLGEFEPEFELDEEEREEIESEFGAEFQSGTEVEEPGEAGIDTPDPEATEAAADDVATDETSAGEPVADESATDETSADDTPRAGAADEAAQSGTASSSVADDAPEPDADGVSPVAESETGDEAETAAEAEISDEGAPADADDEPAEDVDLEDAVMGAMEDLDDGDGADRESVVAAVVDRTGADEAAVEDAIQDALMGGRCYEPDDETLKPI